MPPKPRATRGATTSAVEQENAEASSSSAAPLPPPPAAATTATTDDTPLFLPGNDSDSDEDNNGASNSIAPSPTASSKSPTNEVTTILDADVSDESGHSDADDLDYESDEDPVVREYDVFMTSELAQSLYLFQYPVRTSQKPYTRAQNACPVDARWKTKAGLVEVDVPVNTGLNFDQEKGRVWGDVLRKSQQAKESGLPGKAMGARAGGKRRKIKGEDDDEEEEDIMIVDFQEAVKKGRVLNKQTLGSKIQPDEAKYMVGVFTADQLHLTPLRSTLQLRPQFQHVDAQDAAERAQSRSLRDADETDKPAQARAVHMTVNQEVSQMSSTMKAIRIAEEDEWKKLHWIDQDEDASWDQYELLTLKNREQADQLRCKTPKGEYMDWLSGAMMRKKEVAK
ncbi:Sin-like protein conserved region-domain-containing protein [Sphaerosporella brunnea]|uniref:Sin-like protein conserved region-domain-containing protein n=1 Tax=Sphaerosporella brunnea TaxID=1250544 RepID=A0A5J5ET59_9PEZI|nr:Sin-like protein conserved region-domain-containing protein [Sphaerosporella brunnea]